MIKLTIGIPSIPSRACLVTDLVARLVAQAGDKLVEVLCLIDNKRRSIGAKRNVIIAMAKGEFVVLIDDDDKVSDDYVDSLLNAITSNPNADCIVFDVHVSGYTQNPKTCKYGIEYTHGEDDEFYYRKPNHLMCYKTSIANAHQYEDFRGEDDAWAQRAVHDIKIQTRINKILYYYIYNRATSEGQDGYDGNALWQ